MLEALGVNHCAESVYVLLLKQPMASVRELTETLGLSEEEIHAALDELARLSLVRPSWEDPGSMRPVSPGVGLEYLLTREQAQLLRRQSQIESSRAAVAALIAELSDQQAETTSEVEILQVFGLAAIRAKLEQLAYDTHEQVLSLMPDGPQTADNMEASRPLDEMLLGRGVEVLTLYLESVRNDPASRQYVDWLLSAGGQVRTAAVLPLRMLVFDRKISVVPVNPNDSEIGVAVMQCTGPVAAMCALFETLWETAVPFGEIRSPHRGVPLSEQELAVIRLLAQGHTDATISRKLGVSPRTAGRLVSEIMTRLGARSRFQAGLHVGELGWHLLPAQPAAPGPHPTVSSDR